MNSAGAILEEYNYDPWGRRRNPVNWSYSNVSVPAYTNRGFTGHEHLDMFNLIHMNGRIYDPETARFLSPDPIIQDTYNLLCYNRYIYGMNNPLKYIDPSGYVFTNKGDPCHQNDNNWSWWDHIASKWHNRRRWLSDEPGTHGGSAGTFNYIRSADYYIGSSSTNNFNVEGGVSAHGGGMAKATSTAYAPNAGNISNSFSEKEGLQDNYLGIKGLALMKFRYWNTDLSREGSLTGGGIEIQLSYTAPDVNINYNWLQSKSINEDHFVLDNEYAGETTGTIFYYTREQLPDQIIGNTILFHDAPFGEEDRKLELILSLYNGNTNKVVFIIYYGYKTVNGICEPIYPQLIYP